MRTALLVADVVAGVGLVLLVIAGPSNMLPAGVVIPIAMTAIGLLAGVTLRMFIRDEVRRS